ncbi:MAG TPA: hypothetical protein EYO75_00240, partial [Sulfurimonas sp.]|nr:hypothetical protein [Sulfurimonas sp.]
TVITPEAPTVGTLGSFSITQGGAWTFTANSAFNKLAKDATYDETFNITSVDGTPATVVITITGTNDAPVISSDAQTGSLTEDHTVKTTSGQVTTTDADMDEVTYAITHGSLDTATTDSTQSIATDYGSISFNTITGTWTYTLDSTKDATQALGKDETSVESFTVTATDAYDAAVTQAINVTVNGVNDQTTVVNTTAIVDEDGSVLVNLTDNATDIDGDALVITSASAANGTIENGTYTPDANFNGTDTITYVINDSEQATVTVTVNAVNDAASITGDTTKGITETDDALVTTGVLLSSDVDNANNTFTVITPEAPTVGTLGSFSITQGGAWTFTANSAFN